MKITTIGASNFLRLTHFYHQLTQPVTVYCGPNEAGKSSIRDAIRFALLGEPGRGITAKKDFPLLVHAGTAHGSVELEVVCTEAGTVSKVTRNAATGEGGFDQPVIFDQHKFAFCIDADRFAGLKPDDRRTFLLDLAGVELDPALIGEQLRQHGVPESHVDRVTPLLLSGFSAALTEAMGQRREAKALWRNLAGETWGSKKAESWESPPIAPSYPQRFPCPHCEQAIAFSGEEGAIKASDTTDTEHEAEAVRRGQARTDQAQQHHREAMAWDAICKALAPTGIPATLIGPILHQINARLAETSTHWRTVQITPEMQIEATQRYELLSTSAKWRANAHITEAIAHVSGQKLLILDEFDVLDIENRNRYMGWIQGIASDYDTIIILSTLKQPPNLIAPFEAVWIQGGEYTGKPQQAAA